MSVTRNQRDCFTPLLHSLQATLILSLRTGLVTISIRKAVRVHFAATSFQFLSSLDLISERPIAFFYLPCWV